jgi:hypothetical protein
VLRVKQEVVELLIKFLERKLRFTNLLIVGTETIAVFWPYNNKIIKLGYREKQ